MHVKANGNNWRSQQSFIYGIKIKFSDIEWAQIVGMRNVFTHEYFGIDSSVVWEIIKNDIPELKEKIEHILTSIQ